jgi:hypothetical protein
MKKLNFLAFLVAIAFVSCAKSDDPIPTTTALVATPTVDIATVIVGTWKLSLVGTLMPSTNSGGSSGGCSSDRSENNREITWAPTSDEEFMSFSKSGAFVHIKQANQVCKGTYQLNVNAGMLSNDCSNESRNISGVSEKSLTLSDGATYFRFDKTASTPQ